MSPPLLDTEDEGQSNVSIIASSASVNCISHNGNGLKELNYLGLSECSSVDSSAPCSLPEESDSNLNLKATELRLGLPGSQSPEREPELCMLGSGNLDEKPLFPFLPSKDESFSSAQKNVVSGNKRGFSDTIDGFSEVRNSAGPGKLNGSSGTNVMTSARGSGSQLAPMNESTKQLQDRSHVTSGTTENRTQAANNTMGAPAAKAQVVGWPPIRSFRKNTLATTSKNNEEVDGKPGPGALFVKVSMDGAPYLRKVDLRTYSSYQELSSSLEKMFSCFMIGLYGSNGASGRGNVGERKLKELHHGSECVVTYEDKDGDWMLVGDVPWEMFIDSCKRLKIMKSSDAIGLAPRTVEKSKNLA